MASSAVSQNACPVCGGRFRPLKAWLGQCAACGFYMSDLRAGAGTGIEGLEALRRANFERLLDRLSKLRGLAGMEVLEVGCAKGWFLEAAARRGVTVSGIEPEHANAQIARAAGFDVLDGYFPDDVAVGHRYDMIVFNDVFEHLPDVVMAAKAVEAALKPGGLAVINLPSSRGVLFRLAGLLDRLGLSTPYERLWQKGLPSPHVSYFNPDTLDRLFAHATAMRPRARMSLVTIEREGLHARVAGTTPGLVGQGMFLAAWLLSFVTAWLPPDIIVGIYEKPSDGGV